MTGRARIGPALLLLILAPVVAELLLGDFSIRQFPVILVLLPLYGGAALLIRETARRTGRGWPAMVLLALGYALVEEGFLTQSLFNPDYVGKRLLDYGYLPALGTSPNWAMLVLTIHVVWSVATPILIAEIVAGNRGRSPWLRTTGLAVTSALFLVGCAMTAAFSVKGSPFMASGRQFLVTGLLVLASGAAAFRFTSRAGADVRAGERTIARPAPPPWLVFLLVFGLGSLFMYAEPVLRSRGFPPVVSLFARVACVLGAITLVLPWSRRPGWGSNQHRALAAATTLTYGLVGFTAFVGGHTNLGAPTRAVDIAGQVAVTAAVLMLIAWGGRRPAHASRGAAG